MTKEEMERVKELLINYLEKATGINATEADVAIIPEVVKVLLLF